MASPYALSYYTLPQHWHFMDELKRTRPGTNVLPGGDFELPPTQKMAEWLQDGKTLDDVTMTAQRVVEGAKEGVQCLKLQIKPKDLLRPPAALERTFLAVYSPQVRLTPGTLVQITAWVRVPKNITASVDGALLYDSVGGEPLAIHITGGTAWKKFTLYRRVPAAGLISVTMALTGLGTAYFDDVRIEPMLPDFGPPTVRIGSDPLFQPVDPAVRRTAGTR